MPFAARWPIEVHLLPHRHVPDFAETTLAERDELAPLYLRLLRGVDALYDTPTPYIAAWHQAPVHERPRRRCGCMLQLTRPRRAADKLKFLAGSEAAMGAWIGDVAARGAGRRRCAARSDEVDGMNEVAEAMHGFAEWYGRAPDRRRGRRPAA